MRKQLVIIGIVAILVSVGLSGCNDSQSSSNIEIIDYEIERGNYLFGEGVKVIGTAKNNAKVMQTVTMHGKLYDKDDTYLVSDSSMFLARYSVPAGYTFDFELVFEGEYTQYAEDVTFSFSTS